MDCGDNSKQNLWYLTLHCCILSQNALIPAFLAHKKCGDDAKTTTWCISPAFPGPTHSVRLRGGGGGGRVAGGGGGGTVYFTTVNILTLHINITSKSPFHFSNNIIISQRNGSQPTSSTILQGRKQHIKFPQHDAQISIRQDVCFLISVEGASRIDRHGTHFHHRHFQHNNYVRSECLILFFSFERRSFSHICLLDHVSEVSLSPCFLTGNGRKRKENTTNSLIVSIFSNMTRSRFYF